MATKNEKRTAKRRHDKTRSRPLSPRLHARNEKRRIAVEAVRKGATIESVAGRLKVSMRTVFRWLARYRNGGYHALQERHRPGRPPKVDDQVMRWLYKAITRHDPRQYRRLWSALRQNFVDFQGAIRRSFRSVTMVCGTA